MYDDKLRGELFVNCWHNSERESVEMWDHHCPGGGIVLQTTTERLANSLTKDHIEIAAVNYKDVSPGFMSDRPWTVKGERFRFEQELRAVVRRPDCHEGGLQLVTELHTLIGQIRVSPLWSGWQRHVVQDVVAKYGITSKVACSELTSSVIP
jgi:hypothetical protein